MHLKMEKDIGFLVHGNSQWESMIHNKRFFNLLVSTDAKPNLVIPVRLPPINDKIKDPKWTDWDANTRKIILFNHIFKSAVKANLWRLFKYYSVILFFILIKFYSNCLTISSIERSDYNSSINWTLSDTVSTNSNQ